MGLCCCLWRAVGATVARICGAVNPKSARRAGFFG